MLLYFISFNQIHYQYWSILEDKCIIIHKRHVIYAVFSIYWGRWTLQVLDVSIEKGVGYWIIIVLKKSKFITLYITWERWTLLTSIIAKKGIMKISIILGMIWLLSFSSPEIAEKRESFIIDKFFPLSTNIKIKRYWWKCRLLIRRIYHRI